MLAKIILLKLVILDLAIPFSEVMLEEAATVYSICIAVPNAIPEETVDVGALV